VPARDYPLSVPGMRRCNQCHLWKPEDWEHFFSDSDGPGGLSRKCKPCDNEYQARRRAAIRAGTWAVSRRGVGPARGDGRRRTG
jgi:hypothetical protein